MLGTKGRGKSSPVKGIAEGLHVRDMRIRTTEIRKQPRVGVITIEKKLAIARVMPTPNRDIHYLNNHTCCRRHRLRCIDLPHHRIRYIYCIPSQGQPGVALGGKRSRVPRVMQGPLLGSRAWEDPDHIRVRRRPMAVLKVAAPRMGPRAAAAPRLQIYPVHIRFRTVEDAHSSARCRSLGCTPSVAGASGRRIAPLASATPADRGMDIDLKGSAHLHPDRKVGRAELCHYESCTPGKRAAAAH